MPEKLGACVVCGHADGRALTTTRLSRGDIAVVCGTHELMHRRAERKAETSAELRSMFRNRRDTKRRHPIPDELGARLIEAFRTTTERRAASGDRRR